MSYEDYVDVIVNRDNARLDSMKENGVNLSQAKRKKIFEFAVLARDKCVVK
jgi:hypothetical protein